MTATGITFRYTLPDGRSLLAVDGVDLEVHEGEVLALVGQTGSG